MIIFVTDKKENFVKSDKIKNVVYNDSILKFLEKYEHIAYDSETTGFDPHSDRLFCIQMGVPDYQIVVDVRVVPIDNFKTLLESKKLIGVNLKFDLKFLFSKGIYPTKVEDLMLNEININNGLTEIKDTKNMFSFLGLSKKYLDDEDIDKTVGKSFSVKPFEEPLTEKEIIYSAKDVENPLLIYKEQVKVIAEKSIERTCNLENNFTIALARIEHNGIKLNTDRWSEVQSIVNENLEKIDKNLDHLIIDNPKFDKTKIKIGSKYQPVKISYENMSGDIIKKCLINWSSPSQVLSIFNITGENLDSINKAQLALLKGSNPIIDTYIDRSKYQSLKSKFTDTLMDNINPSTGNIHTDFWQIVSTGRISSNNPNLQQIPSKGSEAKIMRSSFIGDEGELVVTSDISGAELRLIAEASQDPLWIGSFCNGEDLHSVLCSKLFKIDINDVKKSFPLKPDITYRDVIKTINFGLA